MVQKFQSPVRVYKYPFELVMKVNAIFTNLKLLLFAHRQQERDKQSFINKNLFNLFVLDKV